MKKISKKQPTPLIALFGFKPGTAIPGVTNVDTSVRVDLDWMKLHFGRDEQKQEFVCATAGKHSFLLCTTPPEGGRRRKPANKTGWVYLVNSLPTEMLPPWAISRELVYAGFKVTSGRDGAGSAYATGREFVAVEMPGHQRTLLFRNPASGCTDAWTPRRAFGLTETMELHPGETALALESRITGVESIGDSELDALLKELG